MKRGIAYVRENVESSTFSPVAGGQVFNFLCQQEVSLFSSKIEGRQMHTRLVPPQRFFKRGAGKSTWLTLTSVSHISPLDTKDVVCLYVLL